MKKAFVNGQEISGEAVQFELDRLARFYMSHGMPAEDVKRRLPELQEKALEQAIGARLLLDRAHQLDIPVTGEDIDGEIAKVVEQVGSEENYRKALEAQGISEADFRKEIEKGVKVNKLVAQACSGVPEPTEEEVSAYFSEHQDQFSTPPQVLCQHILVKGTSSEAFEKIRAIRERIVKEGADFAEEAKKNSDCPSGQQGGSLGWFGPGMMVPEFDKAAFDMEKGAVSDIITTQFGYHIIYKADEKVGGPANLTDVHDQIKDLLRHEMRGRAMDEFVGELREQAKIDYVGEEHHHHDGCSCGCHH